MTNKTIQHLGVIDRETFYYNFSKNQILLSKNKSNSTLYALFFPVTVTLSRTLLEFLGGQIIIKQFFWRLLLLVGVCVLMHFLASLISQQIIEKTEFQVVILSEERLQLLIKKTKFQIIGQQIITVFLLATMLGLMVELLNHSKMTDLFIFSGIFFGLELIRINFSPSKRRKILKLLEKEK